MVQAKRSEPEEGMATFWSSLHVISVTYPALGWPYLYDHFPGIPLTHAGGLARSVTGTAGSGAESHTRGPGNPGARQGAQG